MTPSSRRRFLERLATCAGVPAVAWAAPGGLPSAEHDASSPEWQRLSDQLFSGRRLQQGQTVVQIVAPLRAAYGASFSEGLPPRRGPGSPPAAASGAGVAGLAPAPVRWGGK